MIHVRSKIPKDRIPIDVLGDIILVFLVGIPNRNLSDIIRSSQSSIFTTWADVVRLRKPIIEKLKNNDKTCALGEMMERQCK